jgi:hypothetical protein
MTGKATYTNRHTGEVYKLGFELSESETELGRAWDLVEMVARLHGWRRVDIKVKCGW